MLDKEHLSRKGFIDLFKTVFDKPIAANVLDALSRAKHVRDAVAHGKTLTDPKAREGLASAFEFTSLFSNFVNDQAGFRPFGDARGFKGRNVSLSAETTRWVLKGMGIPSGRDSSDSH